MLGSWTQNGIRPGRLSEWGAMISRLTLRAYVRRRFCLTGERFGLYRHPNQEVSRRETNLIMCVFQRIGKHLMADARKKDPHASMERDSADTECAREVIGARKRQDAAYYTLIWLCFDSGRLWRRQWRYRRVLYGNVHIAT